MWYSSDTSDSIGEELDIITWYRLRYTQITNKSTNFTNHLSSCIDLIFTSNPPESWTFFPDGSLTQSTSHIRQSWQNKMICNVKPLLVLAAPGRDRQTLFLKKSKYFFRCTLKVFVYSTLLTFVVSLFMYDDDIDKR